MLTFKDRQEAYRELCAKCEKKACSPADRNSCERFNSFLELHRKMREPILSMDEEMYEVNADYHDGYDDGFRDGKSHGYSLGYASGYADAMKYCICRLERTKHEG